MSKMDGLRAMREARFAEAQARAARARSAPAAVAPAGPAPTTKAEPTSEPGRPGVCGHRSMNGRTCIREHGHAAKSHRYG